MCFFMMGRETHWPVFLYPLLLRNVINQSGIWSREANAALLAQLLIKTVTPDRRSHYRQSATQDPHIFTHIPDSMWR